MKAKARGKKEQDLRGAQEALAMQYLKFKWTGSSDSFDKEVFDPSLQYPAPLFPPPCLLLSHLLFHSPFRSLVLHALFQTITHFPCYCQKLGPQHNGFWEVQCTIGYYLLMLVFTLIDPHPTTLVCAGVNNS